MMCETETPGLSESHQQAVRDELNRLVDSPAFRTSKRCREFLAYIVEQTMTGPSVNLKERSIGVELFHLPCDFDSSQHTIVRVTATEVRKKLAQHYLAENGAYHPVIIDLPPGSYSAKFKWGGSLAVAETATPLPAMATSPVIPPPIASAPIAPAQTPPPLLPHIEAPAARRTLVSPIWVSPIMLAYGIVVVLLAGALFLWFSHPGHAAFFTAQANPEAAHVPAFLPEDAGLRLIAGSSTAYVDRSGRTWQPDRFFSGGDVLLRPSERIYRTLDPDIYRHVRRGDFRYDIPLKPGSYELHLHFAETDLADSISAESSGEGQRLFQVSENGNQILNVFDIVADAEGSNISDERVFSNISPSQDGYLHLNFVSMKGAAVLSGIEVLPVTPGHIRPIRIRAGWTAAWQDSDGRQWNADSYFMGGNALTRTTNPARENNLMLPGLALYASERWGHFSYAVPVPDGRYKVTLKFCEGHYGHLNTGIGGVGSRVFDVYCNGVALLKDFDILKEAGGEGRPIDRTFAGIRPTAQGKVVLSFVPVKGMACVNGIEVVEDSH